MIIGNREFDTKNDIYIMGILNVTPDSFFDGNQYIKSDDALRQAKIMIEEGADIIDIGGESTRPGYTKISEDEEISRVTTTIEIIKKEFDVPISIDTYKSKVAKAAFEAGADMLNDIWGLKYDEKSAEYVKQYNKAICLMHNRNNIIEYKHETINKDIYMNTVIEDIKESIDIADRYGIVADKIIIDPGIGFAKNYEMNLHVINNVDKLKIFNFPIMMAASRKSVVGLTLNLPVDERLEGTLATTIISIIKGCSFVRVHDIKANYRAIKMTKSIINM